MLHPPVRAPDQAPESTLSLYWWRQEAKRFTSPRIFLFFGGRRQSAEDATRSGNQDLRPPHSLVACVRNKDPRSPFRGTSIPDRGMTRQFRACSLIWRIDDWRFPCLAKCFRVLGR